MISTLPLLHKAFLEALIEKLKLDDRFDALLAGGSMVHGGLDEHSDIDLVPVVRSEAYTRVLAERREIADSLGNLLCAFTGEHVGEPRLLICLYGPQLLHVDLKFVVLSDLEHLVERPRILWARDRAAISSAVDAATIAWPNRSAEWFEERAWIWLHYGATKLQRGELFEAMGMIAFFREQVLGPMLHRRSGRPQRGVRRIELDGQSTTALLDVVARHDRESVSAALANAIRLYLDLRNDERPKAITPGMPDLLMPLLVSRQHRKRRGTRRLSCRSVAAVAARERPAELGPQQENLGRIVDPDQKDD
ncbi:MAG TPA: hypothetical protein VFT77_14330 [Reyranella sp.]|jgi:hypothetical protein|nr:hypothetical protein [Reyranella sp.]